MVRIGGQKAAIDAAAAAGVRHAAYTSIPNPTDANPAGVVPDHHATERHLAASGLEWTFLRNGLYSESRIPEAQAAVAGGVLRHNLGDGRTAYVSRADCAAAAAAVLAGGDEHSGRAYDITGPELIGAAELAQLYAQAAGTPVEAVNVSDAEFNRRPRRRWAAARRRRAAGLVRGGDPWRSARPAEYGRGGPDRPRPGTPQRGTGARVCRRGLTGRRRARPCGSGREQLLGTDVVEQADRSRGAS